MGPQRPLLNRRAFMATGAIAAAGGAAWVGVSSSWGARFIRQRFEEIGQDIPAAPNKPTPAAWADNAVTLAWLGHATVLINFYGLRILTDPALYRRIGVDLGLGTLGPLRLVQCALTPDELPEIDLVLVSHAHFDHLDTPSLGSIRGKPAAVMAAGTADLLPRRRYSSVSELRWNESNTVKTPRGEVLVRAIEVKHWGARIRRDTWRGYSGWVIEREGRRLLIGGDTAVTATFKDHRRYGPFEAAVMPIGAYDPWIYNHCTPEQAVIMADAANARLIVPVHHQSFQLSNEPFMEPIERIQQALAHEHDRLALREIGQTIVIRS
jgi:L-ascorbate metabolism protein UlaG (beta-lactamase superfamily)